MWPFAVIQHQIFSHSLIKQIQVVKSNNSLNSINCSLSVQIKIAHRSHSFSVCTDRSRCVLIEASCNVLSKFQRNSLTVVSNNLFDSNRKELCGLAEEMAGDIAVGKELPGERVVAVLVDHGNNIAAQIPILSSIASIPMSSPVFTGRYCLEPSGLHWAFLSA